MERQNNKQLITTLAWGFGIYYILTQLDNFITGDPIQGPIGLIKDGPKKDPKPDTPILSTTGCTLPSNKIESMVRLLEEEAQSFRNMWANSSYTETLNILKPLQTDCDVNALKAAFGVRWIGFTRRFDLDETLNYIFGDGNDIAILNNWFKKNRPNITYQF